MWIPLQVSIFTLQVWLVHGALLKKRPFELEAGGEVGPRGIPIATPAKTGPAETTPAFLVSAKAVPAETPLEPSDVGKGLLTPMGTEDPCRVTWYVDSGPSVAGSRLARRQPQLPDTMTLAPPQPSACTLKSCTARAAVSNLNSGC